MFDKSMAASTSNIASEILMICVIPGFVKYFRIAAPNKVHNEVEEKDKVEKIKAEISKPERELILLAKKLLYNVKPKKITLGFNICRKMPFRKPY